MMDFITLYMSIVPNIGRFHIQKLKFSEVVIYKKEFFFHAQNLHFVVQKISLWSTSVSQCQLLSPYVKGKIFLCR